MIRYLEAVIGSLTNASMEGAARSLIDPGRWLGADSKGRAASQPPPEAVLAAAFLARLAGPTHPLFERATAVLDAPPAGSPDEIVAFLRRGVSRVRDVTKLSLLLPSVLSPGWQHERLYQTFAKWPLAFGH